MLVNKKILILNKKYNSYLIIIILNTMVLSYLTFIHTKNFNQKNLKPQIILAILNSGPGNGR